MKSLEATRTDLEDLCATILDFKHLETGENDFCECDEGHAQANTVCRSCFVIALAERLLVTYRA